jgi:hypothetical protein
MIMPGFVPGIHVFDSNKQIVDGRYKPGMAAAGGFSRKSVEAGGLAPDCPRGICVD